MSTNTRRRRSLARQLRVEIRRSIAIIEAQPRERGKINLRAQGQLEALRHVQTVLFNLTAWDRSQRGRLCTCGTCLLHPPEPEPEPAPVDEPIADEVPS